MVVGPLGCWRLSSRLERLDLEMCSFLVRCSPTYLGEASTLSVDPHCRTYFSDGFDGSLIDNPVRIADCSIGGMSHVFNGGGIMYLMGASRVESLLNPAGLGVTKLDLSRFLSSTVSTSETVAVHWRSFQCTCWVSMDFQVHVTTSACSVQNSDLA